MKKSWKTPAITVIARDELQVNVSPFEVFVAPGIAPLVAPEIAPAIAPTIA